METVVLESEPAGKMWLILGNNTKCKRFRTRFFRLSLACEIESPLCCVIFCSYTIRKWPSREARINFIHLWRLRGVSLYFRYPNISFALQPSKDLKAVYHHCLRLRKL